MTFPYKINKKFDYPNLDDTTSENGFRTYRTPYGDDVPSVTTILSTLPHPHLDEWEERIGKNEAEFQRNEAANIGKYMHNYLENFTLGNDDEIPKNDYQKMALIMYKAMKKFGLFGLSEIWGIEEAVFCRNLYAGRSDLFGIYNGKPSIIDYKNSKRRKKPEWIKNYKLQVAGYALAHEEMFGQDVFEQAVILIAIRPDKYNKSEVQKFIIRKDELQELKLEWINVLENYYK